MCPVYFVTHVPGLHPAARNDFGVRPLRRSNIVSAHEFVAPTLGSAMRCLRRSTAQKVNQSSLPLLGGLAAYPSGSRLALGTLRRREVRCWISSAHSRDRKTCDRDCALGARFRRYLRCIMLSVPRGGLGVMRGGR